MAGLCLLAAAPVEAAGRCRLSAADCDVVDREVERERAAEDDARRALNGLDPRQAIPLLADIKMKRMLGRVRVLPPAPAREFLRIGACDVYAELDRAQGSDEVRRNDCD